MRFKITAERRIERVMRLRLFPKVIIGFFNNVIIKDEVSCFDTTIKYFGLHISIPFLFIRIKFYYGSSSLQENMFSRIFKDQKDRNQRHWERLNR